MQAAPPHSPGDLDRARTLPQGRQLRAQLAQHCVWLCFPGNWTWSSAACASHNPCPPHGVAETHHAQACRDPLPRSHRWLLSFTLLCANVHHSLTCLLLVDMLVLLRLGLLTNSAAGNSTRHVFWGTNRVSLEHAGRAKGPPMLAFSRSPEMFPNVSTIHCHQKWVRTLQT